MNDCEIYAGFKWPCSEFLGSAPAKSLFSVKRVLHDHFFSGPKNILMKFSSFIFFYIKARYHISPSPLL